MTSPEPSSEKNNFKSLLIKGVVSATALAGTTAIPLLVQRSLQTPAPPTPSPTVTITPASQNPTPTASPQVVPPGTSQKDVDQDPGKKPKKKP